MRVLFSSTWGYGHVFTMVPLARAFADAGHTVLWAASGAGVERVAEAGIPAVAAGLDRAAVADVERRGRGAARTGRTPDRGPPLSPPPFGGPVGPPLGG